MLALLRTIIASNIKPNNHFRPKIHLFYATTTTEINRKESLPARLVAKAPKPLQPYLKLVRWHQPTGMAIFYYTYTCGIALATPAGGLPDPLMLALFFPASSILRGAGCTLNDILDRNLDAQVSRTKRRPLASGEISVTKAWIFLGAQMGTFSLFIAQFGWYSGALAAAHFLLISLYPLMKRVTYWPQAWLGVALNWGVLQGYCAVTGYVDATTCLPLFLSTICWTVVYDTIYASQDKVDDVKVGIKGTALKFAENTKLWLSGFSTLMVSGLIASGVLNEMAWPYYVSVGLVGTHIYWQLATVELDNPSDCLDKFNSNPHIGLILFCGIVLGICFKKKKEPKSDTSSVIVLEDSDVTSA